MCNFPPEDTAMSAQRLLVVDDEPFNLEIIGEYFDGLGFEIDTAEHGEEAWALLNEKGPYAAIILDRMMPVLDGMGLLKRVKSDERLQSLPVIMQTAAGTPDQVREGLAAGAYYYLVKPFERESLLTIVRGALADNEAREALQQKLAEHGNTLQLMTSAEFSLRTVEEAGALAALLAQATPKPENAVLGLSELLVNAVEHGNLGISYREKSALRHEDRWTEEVARRLALPENTAKRVRAVLARDEAGVSIRICDEGVGFDWREYLEFSPERAFDPNGRGIALAKMTSFDSLEYEGCGNTVVVTIKNNY
jgi:CheY-like chemotaxis protein/anti-sigma regulatory factor (Ser/Thr protein kinase)